MKNKPTIILFSIAIGMVVFILVAFWLRESVNAAFAGGDGSPEDPYQISNCTQLQAMQNDLDASYILINNIDCSDTVNWDSGKGFNPIGCGSGSCGSRPSNQLFIGTFDGGNYTIDILFISRNSENYIGLFGYAGAGSDIRNVGLEGASVSGGTMVGGMVGGLVGFNKGDILNCYSTGSISGTTTVGGLVGFNDIGSISNSYSTSTVSGTGNYVGGLSGYNYPGTITACYATGNVSGVEQVGGLVGEMDYAIIINSYATGNVSGTNEVGGLVGDCQQTLSNSYATGNVSGVSSLGGLVGRSEGPITNCYATGNVSGTDNVGGLIGNNIDGTVLNSYWNDMSQADSCYWTAVDCNLGEVECELTLGCSWDGEYCNWDEITTAPGNDGCTAINNNENYFYNINNAPIISWSFPPWSDAYTALNYPPLVWQFAWDVISPNNLNISSIIPNSSSQLTITADIATDSGSGLHALPYWFQETSGNPGATSSTSWQSSTIFTDTGLSANT